MEQTIAFIIMAIMLGSPQAAQAQNSAQPTQRQEMTQSMSLEDRFEKCMSSDDCTMRERMALMDDMSNDMRETLRQMNRYCAMMDYNECIIPQRTEREQWHKMHGNMKDMMHSMETRSLNWQHSTAPPDESQEPGAAMSKQEPSAGEGKDSEKSRFWWLPKFK